MENLYHLAKRLEELNASDEYIGKVIAHASLANRRDNSDLFQKRMNSDYKKLFQHKEKDRVRGGLLRLVQVLSDKSFDPAVPDRFVEDDLPALVIKRRFDGVNYIVDAIDTLYNAVKEPGVYFAMIGEAFRAAVERLNPSEYDRDKRERSSLEYQGFMCMLEVRISSGFGIDNKVRK